VKLILIGAKGAIGSKVQAALAGEAEIIPVGRNSGEYRADIEDLESLHALFKKVGPVDAVANASGSVEFAPVIELTQERWRKSLNSKLMGQIQLAQAAIPYLKERGSITLVSGILSNEFIASGVAATTVNRAIEGFTQAAATEMPKGIRINVISPTLLKESEKDYAGFFPGFISVEGWKVGQAYKKAILGTMTGQIIQVLG
jgi:NAD(P)-dependent dehydrogenase (short-subunit alcohol dehydrogenase family)